MKNTRYSVYLIHENQEGNKIVGIKEGCDIFDHISKKYDKVIEFRGMISISTNRDMSEIDNYIILNDDYDLTSDEIERLCIDG